jgi:sorbitol/mannitol transport system permease protein
MSAVAESTRTGTPPATPPDDSALARAGAWARRAPLLPALIFMIIITQLPFLVTLGITFMNWNAYYPDEIGFNGLDNYRRVLTDANTRSAIVVTVILTVSVVLISLILGLLIALLLDRQFRGRGVVRTMMITPFLIVPVGRRAALEARAVQPGVRPLQRRAAVGRQPVRAELATA